MWDLIAHLKKIGNQLFLIVGVIILPFTVIKNELKMVKCTFKPVIFFFPVCLVAINLQGVWGQTIVWFSIVALEPLVNKCLVIHVLMVEHVLKYVGHYEKSLCQVLVSLFQHMTVLLNIT